MSFSSDLDRAYDEKVYKPLNDGIKAAAIELSGDLAFETPVDTGAAQWNWLPSIGTPRGDIVASKGDADVRNDAILRADSELNGFNAFVDGSIWISNNLPYIGVLNDGSSQQAPSGFVDALVDQTSRKIKALFKENQP